MCNFNVIIDDFFNNNFLYKNSINYFYQNVINIQKSNVKESLNFIRRIYLLNEQLYSFNFLKMQLDVTTVNVFFKKIYFFKKINTNIYIFFIIFFTKIIFFLVLTSTLLFISLKKIEKITYYKNLILKEIDQEFTNLEDFILWIFLITFMILLVLNVNSLQNFFKLNIIYYSFIFFSLILFIPITITIKTNFNLINYVKGSDNNTNDFVLMVFDFLSTIAYFLRFFLQKIRWVIIITSYYLLHEFFFESNSTNWFFEKNNINSYFFYQNNFFNNIINLFRILFEYLDFILMTLIQFIAFFVVLLWLFNFLFSFSQKNFKEIK